MKKEALISAAECVDPPYIDREKEFYSHTESLRSEIERLNELIGRQALQIIRLTDDPTLDATDFAHAAWWRGESHGVDAAIRVITKVLDTGEVNGTCIHEGLQELRERVWSAAWDENP